MRLNEARKIVGAVGDALQMPASVDLYKPESFLNGYSPTQIAQAFKLLAADQYLSLGGTHGDATFHQAIAAYDSTLYLVFSTFVPDSEFQEYCRLEFGSSAANAMRSRFSAPERIPNVETVGSFVNFCRHVGATDPLYWQKIYTHLGLKFDPASISTFESPTLQDFAAQAAVESFATKGATPNKSQTSQPTTKETAKGCTVIVVLIGVVLALLYWSLR